MSEICVCGYGAVSPAGWGAPALCEALAHEQPLPTRQLQRPGLAPLNVRGVPPPDPRPAFMTHARLRRSSPIAQYAVGAALEALRGSRVEARGSNGGVGPHSTPTTRHSTPATRHLSQGPNQRLGVVLCVMSGCVNYCRRFYDEVLKDPATASPLVFPETVFNAPASHLAAVLGTTALNYTLVGDPGVFLQGLTLAADWLVSRRVDGCLVIGAEELDWLTAGASRLFERKLVVSDGAGALYLQRRADESSAVQLGAVTGAHQFTAATPRAEAARRARAELSGDGLGRLLCDGCTGVGRGDLAERTAWSDWRGARLSPKLILGEGLAAAAAWQCVAAVAALQRGEYSASNVSVVGCNQQAIAAQFVRG